MHNRLSRAEALAGRRRRQRAMHLQLIEGNPLDAEDIAMFEMFEREAWPYELRRDYIVAKAKGLPLPALSK